MHSPVNSWLCNLRLGLSVVTFCSIVASLNPPGVDASLTSIIPSSSWHDDISTKLASTDLLNGALLSGSEGPSPSPEVTSSLIRRSLKHSKSPASADDEFPLNSSPGKRTQDTQQRHGDDLPHGSPIQAHSSPQELLDLPSTSFLSYKANSPLPNTRTSRTRDPPEEVTEPKPHRKSGKAFVLEDFWRERAPYATLANHDLGPDLAKTYHVSDDASSKIEKDYFDPFKGMTALSTESGRRYELLISYPRNRARPQSGIEPYRALIDAHRGTLVVRHMYRPVTTDLSNKPPQVSEVLANMYRQACNNLRATNLQIVCAPLRSVVFEDLSNHRDTWFVINRVYCKTRPRLGHGEQATWRLGEPGFADLMDLPHARVVLWMLRQYSGTLGVRHVSQVTMVWRQQPSDPYYEMQDRVWFMRIDLRGRSPIKLKPRTKPEEHRVESVSRRRRTEPYAEQGQTRPQTQPQKQDQEQEQEQGTSTRPRKKAKDG